MNARECTPSDFARYAEYEINIDSLRRKRVRRLRIKAPAHSGQRRVFYILDRATRKFPGAIGLWMQQIEYARLQKAYKKLSQILTKALRLHPSKPELWTYAAHVSMEEHADMTEARGYMQRGLRFCKGSKSLWLGYTKLELLYVAKLTARQRILGLDKRSDSQRPGQSSNERNDAIAHLPPGPTATDDRDEVSLQRLANTLALSGTIPIAIFDAAMVQFEDDDKFAQDFFDTVQDMDSIACLRDILTHIVDHMLRSHPSSWRTLVCNVKSSCGGIAITSPEFARGFGSSLKTLQGAPPELRKCRSLVDAMNSWLEVFLNNEFLDDALRQIMLSTLRQLQVAADSNHVGINIKG